MPSRRTAEKTSGTPLASVIIPVLGDERGLAGVLASVASGPRIEVIVVSGGEPGAAVAAVRDATPGVTWIVSPPGRARQMNAGAARATGEWLLFLHADTVLSPGWTDVLERSGRERSIVGGSFRLRLDSDRRWARLIERGVALRVRWLNLPYGDQALYVRRDVFAALGGYRQIQLMEDVDLVRRLAGAGRLHHADLPATSSARRWETDGWIHRTAGNVMLVVLFFLGVSPAWLARRYPARRGVEQDGHG